MRKHKKAKNPNGELISILYHLEDEFGQQWYNSDDYIGSYWDMERKKWLMKYDSTSQKKAKKKRHLSGRFKYKYTVAGPEGKEFECYRLEELEIRYGDYCSGFKRWEKWLARRGLQLSREKYKHVKGV